ncbi:integral membrane protein [Colletotrichum cereale]|nr:integral membrane protein [Colletotrichum cereale]
MDDYSNTLSPLPPGLRHGLVAMVTFAGLSFVTSFTLLIYLIGRLALWFARASPKRAQSSSQTDNVTGLPRELGAQYHAPDSERQRRVPNQFLFLLLNVLLADTLQSCAFFLGIIWVVEDGVVGDSAACWLQGWLISTGDLASTAFVATIAVHTYLTLVRGIRIPCPVFYGVIGFLWLLVLLMSVLGVIVTNNGAGAGGFYVRDGAWCWINTKYEILRVALHFIWMVLLITTGTISYVSVFVHFHRKDRALREVNKAAAVAEEAFSDTAIGLENLPPMLMQVDQKTDVHTRVFFLLYPLVFLLCTAPLALSHMMHSAGVKLSTEYLIFAGVLVSSNGWLDVLVFSATRGVILFEAPVDEQNLGLDTFKFMPMGQQYGHRVWIQGGPPADSRPPERPGLFRKPSCRAKLGPGGRHDRSESQTSLHDRRLNGIQLETVTRVFVEEADSKVASMASVETVGKRVQQSVDSCR